MHPSVGCPLIPAAPACAAWLRSMTARPEGGSPGSLVSPVQARLPVALTLMSLATIPDSAPEPPTVVQVVRTTQNGRAAAHARCGAEWDHWQGAVSSSWDLHGRGLLLHTRPERRGRGPTPGLRRFPQPLQAALILSVWLYFSPCVPRVFCAPPTNQQAQQCHVLSFASAGLAHLSVP